MVSSVLTHNPKNRAHSTREVCLVCDGCKRKTASHFTDPFRDVDEWTRGWIKRDGWTRRLDGRYLRDYCPDCSRVSKLPLFH